MLEPGRLAFDGYADRAQLLRGPLLGLQPLGLA